MDDIVNVDHQNHKNLILYPFINVAKSTLYIDNKKIDNFSLIQQFSRWYIPCKNRNFRTFV